MAKKMAAAKQKRTTAKRNLLRSKYKQNIPPSRKNNLNFAVGVVPQLPSIRHIPLNRHLPPKASDGNVIKCLYRF